MNITEVEQKDSRAVRSALRYSALLAPIPMLIYGYLIELSFLPPVHPSAQPSLLSLILLSLAWLLLGTLTFSAKQPANPIVRVGEVASYYILAAFQIWLVNGFQSPFSALLVLLMVTTYAMLGRNGFQLGILALLIIGLVDAVILEPGNLEWLIGCLVTWLALVVSSLAISWIYATQSATHRELELSRLRETSERERILTLINNITDAVISTDQKGMVRTYNSAALDILDTNDNIDGRKLSSLLKLTTTEGKRVDLFKELSKNGSIRRRDDLIMSIDADDSLRLEATFAPVKSSASDTDEPDGYVLILRDVTRMKSLEEERDEFISVVSHELRTPVTIAEGSLDNAEIFAEKGMGTQATAAIAEAHKQVLYLAKMINDLSTLSRAERGISGDGETIDTRDLAHQLHTEYTPEADNKKLSLNLDIVGIPGEVYTSKLYLKELMQNFITNAIKYTQKGSVTIKLERIDNEIEFSVSDTGIGIGKADLDNIFKRFYRAEDYRTRETNGTGLGLYVASKLARKLGCKINATSRLNHGSSFSFRLTAADTAKSTSKD